MKILLTGASSYLGEHVVRALCARGELVVVTQRRAAPVAAELGLEQHLGDITDYNMLTDACRGVDRVIHAAAKVGVVGTQRQFVDTNVFGTAALLSAARDAGVGGLIHISSPSVAHTGNPIVGGGAEPANQRTARGHYSQTKAAAERLVLLANSAQFPTVAIRPHLVWGPGDTQLVARIVDRARRNRLVLVGGGHALVDTTYVDNAVSAILAATDRVGNGIDGEALVISNGQPRTVSELFEQFAGAAGLPAPRRSLPVAAAYSVGGLAETFWGLTGRQDDPPMTRFLATQLGTAHWFDLARTRGLLDWEPTVDLDEGFARLASWYRTSS